MHSSKFDTGRLRLLLWFREILIHVDLIHDFRLGFAEKTWRVNNLIYGSLSFSKHEEGYLEFEIHLIEFFWMIGSIEFLDYLPPENFPKPQKLSSLRPLTYRKNWIILTGIAPYSTWLLTLHVIRILLPSTLKLNLFCNNTCVYIPFVNAECN